MTKKQQVTKFWQSTSSLTADFRQDSSGAITKDAILMLEGTLPDSKGVSHSFTAERLETIAENTNTAIAHGVKLPVLLEHDKTALSTCGNGNNAELYVKRIDAEDIAKINPKATKLIGKAALFVKNLVIQTPAVVEKVLEGTASSVSMGLDLLSDSLKEISLVGIPAWEYASLYKKAGTTAKFSALTWDEDEAKESDLDGKEEAYEDLTEQLWTYLRNIYTADESELQGKNPTELIDVTLYGFVERVKKLLDLNGEDGNEIAPSPNGTGVALDPAVTTMSGKYSTASFAGASKYTTMLNGKMPRKKAMVIPTMSGGQLLNRKQKYTE